VTEADYVRSQAKHDREERAKAIVELRASEARCFLLIREISALQLRVAELEEQQVSTS
jgi:hypothetical protein